MTKIQPLRIFAIVGSCGAGKTSVLNQLPAGILVHKEGYIEKDNETIFIDNQLYHSKLRYMSSWFLSMYEYSNKGYPLVVSDRCPIDNAAYVEKPALLFELIEQMMLELTKLKDRKILIETIYIRVDFKVCRSRVKQRLLEEPMRVKYHEDNARFLKKTWQFYEDFSNKWDHVVDNNNNIGLAVESVKKIIYGAP